MTRQIILDTETTGLHPEDGERIIEIGCIEIINRKITSNSFHTYLNPEKPVSIAALEVHGINNDFLADKPKFADIAEQLIAYLKAAEIIIHNAGFDTGFLNHEIAKANQQKALELPDIETICTITDSLALAKKKHPGQRNSLDALCKRYQVDNSQRNIHGALLDAQLLTEVYLSMTGGQISLALETDHSSLVNADNRAHNKRTDKPATEKPPIKVVYATKEDINRHQQWLAAAQHNQA